jgi:hypothetical protein
MFMAGTPRGFRDNGYQVTTARCFKHHDTSGPEKSIISSDNCGAGITGEPVQMHGRVGLKGLSLRE